jgi:hypothetical protein
VLAVLTTFEIGELAAADHVVAGLDDLGFRLEGDAIIVGWRSSGG